MIRRIQPLVSTIIPVFNRPEMLMGAVQSVLDQEYRRIEVIISDDGSTDGTLDVAESLIRRYPDKIKLVRNTNSGPGPAREAGRLLAQGEFIQYLDSDDRLLPNKFADQLRALEDHPECGITYGTTRLIDENGEILEESFKWTDRQIDSLFPALLVDRWWCTHTPLYRRSVTDAVGPWTDLRYSQDWEYDARVGALRVKLIHCGSTVSEHRKHSGTRQTGSGKWLDPLDQVEFYNLIMNSARSAGIRESAPEFRHFSRWLFSKSREAAVTGEGVSARRLFELARASAGTVAFGLDAYRCFCRLLGWKTVARISEFARRTIGKSSGRHTLRQSWMANDT